MPWQMHRQIQVDVHENVLKFFQSQSFIISPLMKSNKSNFVKWSIHIYINAINYLLNQGITGLQWFAYIPGTVGGATFYNIHGGTYHFSDYLDSIEAFNLENGKIETFQKKDLE
ncbi:MAG: hypothetical protein HGA23_10220 [Bacteroidales bacterium]|nr:hypothetical protein [Bacteroidales bacterium]